jgi:uncharacterized protein YfaS (alpha-2-macroglobulin family)
VRRAFFTPDGKPRPEGPFRQGESVVVKITLEMNRLLSNVVVVDAFPAGFEIENPNLLTADGDLELDHSFGVDRCDMRDDRLVLFANPGRRKCSYAYVVRAVTAGSFALPPIGAECMYDTEIRSLHGGGEVKVVQ